MMVSDVFPLSPSFDIVPLQRVDANGLCGFMMSKYGKTVMVPSDNPETMTSFGIDLDAGEKSRTITHVSANANIAIGWRADALLGASLATLLGEGQLEILRDFALLLPSPEP